MANTDTKCPLLWNHLHISLGGNHSPCCHSQVFKDQGSWKEISWGQFDSKLGILSEQHVKARQQMREGKRVPLCEVCYRREDKGLVSKRINAFKDAEIEQWQIDYDSEPTSINSMDVKFDRTCNLGCRMCEPGQSSFLNRDLSKLQQQDRFANEQTEWNKNYQQNEKLELAKRAVKDGLQTFKTTGGEPFLQRHFIEFVDWCIEQDYAKDLTMRITTNLILANKKLLNKLFQFREIGINVSCDAVGDVYEYIRYPAKWSDFDSKWQLLTQIVKQNPQTKVDLTISSVLQIYNLFNLNDIQKYFQGYDWNVDQDLQPDGSELSVENLPQDVLDNWLAESEHSESSQISEVADYIKLLHNTDKEYKLKEFARKTLLYDHMRMQDYTVLDQPVIQLINNYK